MKTPARILYLDDPNTDSEPFLRSIDQRGLFWNVTVASTVAEAHTHLVDSRFDVVVASRGLEDGEAAGLREQLRGAPLVLIVAGDGEEAALDALERGADDYVVRGPGAPDPSDVIRAVGKSLQRRKAPQQKTRQLRLDLHDSEQQLRAVFDNAASGIILTDAHDRLVAVNDRLCQMLGYTRDQLLGMRMRDLTYPEDRGRTDDLNARILDEPVTNRQYEMRYLERSGSLVWVEVSVSAVCDEAGRHLYSVATIIDITARKQAEAQLRLQAAALAAAPHAVSLSKTDEHGTIVWVNDAFTRLTGYTAEEAIGLSHHVLSSGQQDESFYRQLWETIKAGSVWRGELVNRRKDGTLYREEMGITAIVEDGGRVSHYVAIKQDITERKEVEVALAAAKREAEEARAEAEEASRAKDHFLAMLSHELRTPLAPVVTALALLQRDSSLSERAQAQVAVVHRNVDLESRLIDDLLDVTRIARGRIDLDRQLTDLRVVLERAIEVCRPDIDARHVHFGVDAEGTPYPLYADNRRLEQVFWNLLKNSIKFTPQGGCIGIRCRRQDHHVVVEVIDSGMGMESGVADHIFDAFAKGVDSRSRRFGGLGLGLAISRALVEMHGGTISASSDGPDKGATLTVRLPVASAVGAADATLTTLPEDSQMPGPLSILLVEDHGDTAEMMQLLLEQDGHRVERAADVASALALATGQAFDLLLSDLGLPDGSGLDLIREMRVRGVKASASIALTGYGQEQDVQQTREAGFDAHLVKPVEYDRLVKAMSAVISAR